MACLLIVSFIWAFSFGLIKTYLAGVDPSFVVFARMLIAFLVFAPFIRLEGIRRPLAVQFLFLGMFQFGVMYITYIYSYRFLMAYQVALYTIFTPIYVTLINDLLDRRFRLKVLLTALLAIAGTYIIVRKDIHLFELKAGFLLLQASNLCFASGQILYKKWMAKHPEIKDRNIFGLLYLGALLVTGLSAGITTEWASIDLSFKQGAILIYLGLLASGIGFFLWNFGARRTRAGTLAILNNMKVPLGVACSILFFHEEADLLKLLAGGGIILAALFLNEVLIRDGKT
jgi:carboxylate/amino acid/amine transporter